MRRQHRAWLLRRLALWPAFALSTPDSAAAAMGSRRATPCPGPVSATAGAGRGVDPTHAPVGAGGASRPAPSVALVALFARLWSTPLVA